MRAFVAVRAFLWLLRAGPALRRVVCGPLPTGAPLAGARAAGACAQGSRLLRQERRLDGCGAWAWFSTGRSWDLRGSGIKAVSTVSLLLTFYYKGV